MAANRPQTYSSVASVRLGRKYYIISITMCAHIFFSHHPFEILRQGQGLRRLCFPLCMCVCACERRCCKGWLWLVTRCWRIKCLLSAAKRDAWGRALREPLISCVCVERQLNLKTHGFCFCACARRRIHFSRESTKKKL